MIIDMLFQELHPGDVVVCCDGKNTFLTPAVILSITNKGVNGKLVNWYGYLRCPIRKAHERLLKLTPEQTRFLADSFKTSLRTDAAFQPYQRQIWGADK